MSRTTRILIATLLLSCVGLTGRAQSVCDSVRLWFVTDRYELNPAHAHDLEDLVRFERRIDSLVNSGCYTLQRAEVHGYASPEGPAEYNYRLSARRAVSIFARLRSRLAVELPDSLTLHRFHGRNWTGLRERVIADTRTPARRLVLSILDSIIDEHARGRGNDAADLRRLKRVSKGWPYRYMLRNHFADLRTSWLKVTLTPCPADETADTAQHEPIVIPPVATVDTAAAVSAPAIEYATLTYPVALRTNLLHDLLLIPNIGIEIPLPKGWSVGAQWSYGWWTNMPRQNRYIHLYGGDLNVRKYFKPCGTNALCGQHLGVYAQMYSYDYKLGDYGYWGERWSVGAGLEYGLSLPLCRNLNLDMTAGVGYLTGIYRKYWRDDDCDVWQATRRRHWLGPTKLEVSLVWLLDLKRRVQKGGAR